MSSQDSTTSPFPDVSDHSIRRPSYPDDMSSTSSTTSVSDPDQTMTDPSKLQRPRLGSRKSSGTIIIPRESEQVELKEEEYDDGDARTMSPRRSSEEIEKMGQEARQSLIDPFFPTLTFARQAKVLQASLMEIVDRVEIVKNEHEKLEGGNKFLQSYIGELMQTSKITSAGAAKGGKGKGRGRAIK